MSIEREIFLQRLDDCRELYIKYDGKQHERIEREMREMGHTDFHRRSLHRRFENGSSTTGWIELGCFDQAVRRERKKRKDEAAMAAAAAEHLRLHGPEPAGWGSVPFDDVAPFGPRRAVFAPMQPGLGPFSIERPELRPAGPELDFDEFKNWLKQVSPDKEWDWKHMVYIYKKLRRVTSGELKRLMIFMPPRHGKSELVTMRYAAWRLKLDPSLRVVIGCYNQRLANRFSRGIRRVLADDAAVVRKKHVGIEEGSSSDAKALTVCHYCLRAANSDKRDKRDKADKNRNKTSACAHKNEVPASAADETSVFPFVKARPANTEAEWETTRGGGVKAVGVGGGVTGFGANLIIIDDPIKSRAEAESDTLRDNVWEWFNDDIYTRLEPNAAIVLIQTRWHEDDLAGRLLREAKEGGEQWEVINLPALAEPGNAGTLAGMAAKAAGERGEDASVTGTANGGEKVEQPQPRHAGGTGVGKQDACAPVEEVDEKHAGMRDSYRLRQFSDPLRRSPGEALWPERFPVAVLERTRKKLGSDSFAALYQQRPAPASGGLFKRAWFRNFVSAAPPGLNWKRGYDLGISVRATADYTASYRVAFDKQGNMYIDGGYRARLSYPEQRRYILGRIANEPDTEHGIELSANGTAVVQDLRKEESIRGRAFRGIPARDGKVANALPWIALAEEGKVFLVRAAWNTDFIDEACSFPVGTHDDQIDAVSIAVRMTSGRGSAAHMF